MSDMVHSATYEDLLKTHRILVFTCAEIMKLPPTEDDKPILVSSTSVTNLVPDTAKDDEKLIPVGLPTHQVLDRAGLDGISECP